MSDTGHIKCPRCGKALPVSAPEGLCPACLGALNFATETDLPGVETREALPPLTPQELAPHFPQLEILECLGRGGMGVVYKARQRTLNRLVALKLLAPERVQEAKFADRFAREAQALAALNHPNIVTIHDFGKAGGFYYLLMEFVDGLNLRQILRTRKLQPAEALAIVPPVCEALQYAHDHGIVHRDIKPENLLLAKDGRVKIADFGIAKMLGSPADESSFTPSATGEGGRAGGVLSSITQQTTIGTPQYMAPEQREQPQNTDHRTDIYALGVVLYELLTGELPTDKLHPPSRKVQIDVRLDEVVLRALAQLPELRYQSAGEFKTQVETIVGAAITQPSERKPDVDTDTSPSWMGFHASNVIFFAGVTVAILVIGLMPFRFSRDTAYLLTAGPMLLIAALAGAWVQRSLERALKDRQMQQLTAIKKLLHTLSITAWLTATPVIPFALFFLISMQLQTGSWNPAVSEAVLVPLTWIGALLLPYSALRLSPKSIARWLPEGPGEAKPMAGKTVLNIFGKVCLGSSLIIALLISRQESRWTAEAHKLQSQIGHLIEQSKSISRTSNVGSFMEQQSALSSRSLKETNWAERDNQMLQIWANNHKMLESFTAKAKLENQTRWITGPLPAYNPAVYSLTVTAPLGLLGAGLALLHSAAASKDKRGWSLVGLGSVLALAAGYWWVTHANAQAQWKTEAASILVKARISLNSLAEESKLKPGEELDAEMILNRSFFNKDGLLFIDLDRNRFFTPPMPVVFNPATGLEMTPELLAWLTDNRIDLLIQLGNITKGQAAGSVQANMRGINLYGAITLDAGQLDKALRSGEDLGWYERKLLEAGDNSILYADSVFKKPHDIYRALLHTVEGNYVALKWVCGEFSDDQMSLKYKLIGSEVKKKITAENRVANPPAATNDTLEISARGTSVTSAYPRGQAGLLLNSLNLKLPSETLATCEVFIRYGDNRREPVPALAVYIATSKNAATNVWISWKGERQGFKENWLWSVNGNFKTEMLPLPARLSQGTNMIWQVTPPDALFWRPFTLATNVTLRAGKSKEITLFHVLDNNTNSLKQLKEILVRITCNKLPEDTLTESENHRLVFGTDAHSQSFPKKTEAKGFKFLSLHSVINTNGYISVSTITSLLPGESIQPVLRFGDGRLEPGSIHYSVTNNNGVVDSDWLSLTWQPNPPLTPALNKAAEQQIRTRWANQGIELQAGQSARVFTLTNAEGVKIYGEVNFKQLPPTANPDPSVSLRINNTTAVGRSLMVHFFEGTIPEGQKLIAAAASSAGNPEKAITSVTLSGRGPSGAFTWMLTPRIAVTNSNNSKDEISKAAKLLTEEAARQINSLAARGPILIHPGKPTELFSIRDAKGETYTGSLELVGSKP